MPRSQEDPINCLYLTHSWTQLKLYYLVGKSWIKWHNSHLLLFLGHLAPKEHYICNLWSPACSRTCVDQAWSPEVEENPRALDSHPLSSGWRWTTSPGSCWAVITSNSKQWTSSSPVGGVYCYFRADVASMTTRQELAMLPLYNVSSAALYWTVQPSCCQSCEARAVRRFLP